MTAKVVEDSVRGTASQPMPARSILSRCISMRLCRSVTGCVAAGVLRRPLMPHRAYARSCRWLRLSACCCRIVHNFFCFSL